MANAIWTLIVILIECAIGAFLMIGVPFGLAMYMCFWADKHLTSPQIKRIVHNMERTRYVFMAVIILTVWKFEILETIWIFWPFILMMMCMIYAGIYLFMPIMAEDKIRKDENERQNGTH